ncbi:hypothetical protein [Brunnivagina elsteri]|uniref:Uncharacterized protein n=1 Tax=Brunnivagina elsteri CCALA 953 TaxID=987040 RepID=A0A2A2TAZ4_9CYAN|nr:hypothetical protein [Calothrix elsteri]PAX48295.1 hypothetical protein CK510_28310 [Calothrix elsteri CCALA 953]
MPFLDDSLIIPVANSSIITSSIEPSNPQVGDMWNELDNDNNLIQQWNYLTVENNPRWVSQLYYHSWQITTGASNTVYLINPDFDIFVKQYYIHIFTVNQTIISGEFYNRRLSLGSQGGGNIELLANAEFNSLNANSHEFLETPVNFLITGTKYRGVNTQQFKNLINTNVITNKVAYSAISTVPTFTYLLVRK